MSFDLTNRILGGRYRLIQEIGGGGMGSVFRALDLHNNHQEVAVKILHAPLLLSRGDAQIDLRRRFAEEIRISILLGQHPRIVKVLDHGQEGEQAYLVMEYLKGQDLGKLMREKGALPLRQVIRLALQACEGLHFAHTFRAKVDGREIRGVIHRDIKPSNLFLEQVLQEGQLTSQLKILDFGVAKTLADHTLSLGTHKGGGFIGTARYASPEQIRGKSLDARSDIYSFGVVLYEMLTGSMPFQLETDSLHSWIHAHCYESPLEINPETTPQPIPPALAAVVMDCLKKNPDERPQTMQELGERLLQAYELTVATQLPSSQASTVILPTGGAKAQNEAPPSSDPRPPIKTTGNTGSASGAFEDIRDEDLDLVEDEPIPPAGAGIPYYIAEREPLPSDPSAEAVAGSGGIHYRHRVGRQVAAFSAIGPDQACSPQRDDHCRDPLPLQGLGHFFGLRGCLHRGLGKSSSFTLVEHQVAHLAQQGSRQGHHRGWIEQDGDPLGKGLLCHRLHRGQGDFQLQQNHRCRRPRRQLGGGVATVSAGADHNPVLPCWIHSDQSDAAGPFQLPQVVGIDAVLLQVLFQQAAKAVRSHCPPHLHLGSRPCRCHRLVGPLAARVGGVVGSQHRFPRPRMAWYLHHQVQIQAPHYAN